MKTFNTLRIIYEIAFAAALLALTLATVAHAQEAAECRAYIVIQAPQADGTAAPYLLIQDPPGTLGECKAMAQRYEIASDILTFEHGRGRFVSTDLCGAITADLTDEGVSLTGPEINARFGAEICP